MTSFDGPQDGTHSPVPSIGLAVLALISGLLLAALWCFFALTYSEGP